jgi:mono/diheme cytochrome c family protein
MKTTLNYRRIASLLCGLVALGVLTPQHAIAAGQAVSARDVTFTKDVAPILQRSCQNCHRPGGMAPMSLLTFEEVRPWARAIKLKTSLREMPPWFIERNIGIQKFKDDPSLSDEEIAKIASWVDNGAPRGNPADMPAARQFADAGAWTIGTPDLIVSSPVITVKPVAPDLQADIGIVPVGLTEDRYVKAVQVREIRLSEREVEGTPTGPRAALNISILHHANIQARTEFDEDSDQPDSTAGRRGGEFGLVHELGQNATIYPDQLGVLLPANSLLSWRVHTHSTGKEVQTRLDIGFKLHPKGFKPKYALLGNGGVGLANHDLDIPAGQDNVRVDAYRVLKTPAKFMTFEPHMHASGKRMCIQAIYPTGARQTLNCAGYNHNWVKVYNYDDDVAPLLPAGTIVHVIGWYDNSAKNPRNVDPRNWKGFGNRSIDDMMINSSKYIPLTEEDYKAELATRQAKQRGRSTN